MSLGGSRRCREYRRRMVVAVPSGELFGSSTKEVNSDGAMVDEGIIAAAIMAEITVGEISTTLEREAIRRWVTFTSMIDRRSEITISSSSSRIAVVDGRETPEEEEEEDSGTGAGVGRMNSSRSRDR